VYLDKESIVYKEEGDYLGFTINSQSTKFLVTQVEAIIEMNKLKDISELRQFLGIINFYRSFNPNAAGI